MKKRRLLSWGAALSPLALALAFALVAFVPSVFAELPADTATKVWGQANYTNSSIPAPTASRLDRPTSVVTDSSGGIYVAERNNNRVLYFPSGSVTATRV